MSSIADANARSSDLRWPSSLGFRLALALLLLLGALGAGAYYASRFLLHSGIEEDVQEFEQAGARRAAAELESLLQRIEGTAALLGQLAVAQGGAGALRPSAVTLLDNQSLAPLIDAVGFWPEPNSVDSARDRASLYWVRDAAGKWQLRGDYNDPRAVPYYREQWYTPARYVEAGRCYWTPPYQEPLARREVVSCAMPMRNGRQFVGVVTLSLGVERLGHLMDTAAGTGQGYALLVDGQGQILGASPAAAVVISAGGRPGTLAELAQKQPGFNPLALALHRQGETLRKTATGAAVEGADIIALKTATRDFSSADADRVLSYLRWAQAGDRQMAVAIKLPGDGVIGGSAAATLVPLPAAGWNLIRVLPAGRGLIGARQLFVQTMALAGMLALALLLLTLVLTRLAVLDPLRRMVRRLAAAGTSDDPLKLVLDESPRNEIGALAFWINERSRQLRESLDRASAGQLQLSIEAKERRSLTEQLTRYFERAQPAMQAVADAVITADEHNNIEDLNLAAEQLLGVNAAALRGKPLAETLKLRAGASDVTAAAAALAVIQRGTRFEPREPFTLDAGGRSREVRLSILPVRSRGNRTTGAVLLLREAAAAAVATAGAPAPSRAAIGLPGREACEKRTSELIAAARQQSKRHSLLVVDLDQLRRINEIAGRGAGDEAIGKLADTVVQRTGGSGEVFHLHADRFAVLLPGADSARASAFAQALREAIALLRTGSGGKALGFTASLGLDEFGGEANAADVLLRAEDACAAAKRAGRNAFKAYDSSMPRAERDVDDATWVRRVRAGLEQDMLHLTTQFVAPSQAAAAASFESLLALEDEEGFWSPAAAFMPAAERHGLAAAVDRWHLGNVARQLLQGENAKRVTMTGMQISQSSLLDPQLADFLIALTEKHKALKGKLCLLITESSILSYPNQAQALSEVLRAIGMPWAISDFLGRDPATLLLLRQLSAEWVRVDARRFRAVVADPAEQKLADSVLQLARSLQKQAWVYGIEDSPALETWKRLGATLCQGGAVAKPSPVLFQKPAGT